MHMHRCLRASTLWMGLGLLAFCCVFFQLGEVVHAQKKPTLRRAVQPSVRTATRTTPTQIREKQTKPAVTKIKRRYYRRLGSKRGTTRPQAGTDLDCWSYLRRTRQRYCVELLTFGQGDWLFTFFGHNALRVVSRRGDIVYNFGTFSMAKPLALVFNYLQFKVQYQLGTIPYRYSRFYYQKTNRTTLARRLLLTNRETVQLVRHLRRHYLPQNRKYAYHHYLANCSTKVRDALRSVFGDAFYQAAQVKRGATYRQLVMKSMAPNPFVLVAMDFGMGPPADRPLTWWQEMFLPYKLDAFVTDPTLKKKLGRAVVGGVRTVYTRTKKPAAPFSAVRFIVWVSIFWLVLALLLFKKRALRWYIRATIGLFALLGTVLFLMMFATNFPEPPGNANIVWYHPLLWILWWWLGRKRWVSATSTRKNWIRWILWGHVLLGCGYLVLKWTSLVPYQVNVHYVAWALMVFGVSAVRLQFFKDWGAPHKPEGASQELLPQALQSN